MRRQQRIAFTLLPLLGGCLDTYGTERPQATTTDEASEPPPEATSSGSGPPAPATTADLTTSDTGDTSGTSSGVAGTTGTTAEPTTGSPVTCVESDWSPHVVSFEEYGANATSYLLSGLAIAESGDLVIAGTSSYPANYDAFITKLIFDGATWNLPEPPRTFDSIYTSVEAMAMDRSGDIYLAGNFYSTVKPCHGQQNPDLCPPDLISWSPKNHYDAYVVKLDGTTLDAVWGLPHDAGGPDGALALTVKENKLVAVTGYCNGNADVLAMVFGADGGLLSSACFASTSPNTAGWATQWLPDGHAMIAGVFATSLALGDPPLTAGSTDASGFFAALHPLNLKPQATPQQFGVVGTNLVQSMAVLPDGSVALGGSCSGGWMVAGQTCGSDRTPFVLTMDPDGGDLQRTVLQADQPGAVLDLQPTADGEHIVVGGVLSPGGPVIPDLSYTLGTGYATLLRVDSLEKVREWTLQGATSQVRSITVDPEGGILFGGTLAESAELTEWSESFTDHKATVPPGLRLQNTFVIRECPPE